MAYNKIIYGAKTLIDLTADTVTAETLAKGKTAHDKSGKIVTGTSTKDVDSSDATATEDDILEAKTAYARGAKLTGRMPNVGSANGEISTRDGAYAIPQGYHDGGGKVQISEGERAKIVAKNIREGVTVLGVLGTLSPGEGITAQEKTVTPSTSQQIITPDEGFTYLSQVTVLSIPYVEAGNSAGGITVTIGR